MKTHGSRFSVCSLSHERLLLKWLSSKDLVCFVGRLKQCNEDITLRYNRNKYTDRKHSRTRYGLNSPTVRVQPDPANHTECDTSWPSWRSLTSRCLTGRKVGWVLYDLLSWRNRSGILANVLDETYINGIRICVFGQLLSSLVGLHTFRVKIFTLVYCCRALYFSTYDSTTPYLFTLTGSAPSQELFRQNWQGIRVGRICTLHQQL